MRKARDGGAGSGICRTCYLFYGVIKAGRAVCSCSVKYHGLICGWKLNSQIHFFSFG